MVYRTFKVDTRSALQHAGHPSVFKMKSHTHFKMKYKGFLKYKY